MNYAVAHSMKGFVTTPPDTVDTLVALLFQGKAPGPSDHVLDPGCGTGMFIDGIIRWCVRRGLPLPQITGVESDPRHIPFLESKYADVESVRIEHADFLDGRTASYDFVVGNPPYVPITAISEQEKTKYRSAFLTARGRFDLYLLFFEQALRSLEPGGRLVFITPEKYLYVESAAPLRAMLGAFHVEEIRQFPEDTFGDLVTYPTITVVRKSPPRMTRIFRRDGTMLLVRQLPSSSSWLPELEGASSGTSDLTLGAICRRISCGVATGADGVFVRPLVGLDPALLGFTYPTVAGRELAPGTDAIPHRFGMLVPYDRDGGLTPLNLLGALRGYLEHPVIRSRLAARTCARRKPWYAFHETPALNEILRPKILCKDITDKPRFWVDASGEILPRHSVYYIVPRDPDSIEAISSYLRSPAAQQWLAHNCQRAAQGFLRVQSRTLQRLPIPSSLAVPLSGPVTHDRIAIRPTISELTHTRLPTDAHTI